MNLRLCFLLGGWLIAQIANAADGASQADVGLSAQAAPEWDALFQCDAGWIGADGDFSVALSKDTTLWLFSDTFIGTISGGKRTNATMVNNSIALQHGTGRPEFFYGKNAGGKPAAFIVPQDGRGYFWIFSGARTRKGLHFFLEQEESNGKGGAFGFHIIGTWLAEVSNPDDPPPQWKITQQNVPFGDFSSRGEAMFGSATLADHGYLYIYGVAKDYSGGQAHAPMLVARVPEEHLNEFERWRFFSDGRWVKDWKRAARLGTEVASEYSVSYLPAFRQYAVVTSSGISGKIMLSLGPTPTGPWDKQRLIYECPEQKWPGHNFCYAGKAHPELSTSQDELLITYAANSFNFAEVVNDARLYWPRFVRLRLESPMRK